MELLSAWSLVELGGNSPFSHVIQWSSAVALTLSTHLQDCGLKIAVNMHLFKLPLTREIPKACSRKTNILRLILAPLSFVKCREILNSACLNHRREKKQICLSLSTTKPPSFVYASYFAYLSFLKHIQISNIHNKRKIFPQRLRQSSGKKPGSNSQAWETEGALWFLVPALIFGSQPCFSYPFLDEALPLLILKGQAVGPASFVVLCALSNILSPILAYSIKKSPQLIIALHKSHSVG